MQRIVEKAAKSIFKLLRLCSAKYGTYIAFVVLAVASACWSAPSFYFDGDFWAEMATVFYKSYNSPSLTEMWFVDAGYVPFAQHLLANASNAALDMFGLTDVWRPFAMSWAALLLSAFLAGTLLLPMFAPLLPSLALRGLIVGIFWFGQNYEMHSFVNAPYSWTLFAVSALSLIGSKAYSPKDLTAAWPLPLIMLSKPSFLAVAPMALFAMVINKDKRAKFICAAAASCAGGQALVLIHSKKNALFQAGTPPDFSITDGAAAAWAIAWSFPGQLLSGNVKWLPPDTIMTALLVAWVVGLLWAKLRMPKRNSIDEAGHMLGMDPQLSFFLGMLTLFVGSITLNSMSLSAWTHGHVAATLNRPAFIPIASGLSTIILLMNLTSALCMKKDARADSGPKIALITALFWLWRTGWTEEIVIQQGKPNFPVVGASMWQQASDGLKRTDWCIPISPLGWVFEKGKCTELTKKLSLAALAKLRLDPQSIIKAPLPEPARVPNLISAFVPLGLHPNSNTSTISGALSIHDAEGRLLGIMFANYTGKEKEGGLFFSSKKDIDASMGASFQLYLKDRSDLFLIRNADGDFPATAFYGYGERDLK